MKVVPVKQNTPEWIAFRQGKIGASMAPAIMGVSPYQTKLEAYLELIGQGKIRRQTSSMKRGHDLEPVALEMFRQEMGLFEIGPIVIQHDDYDWMIASLDGFSDELDGVVEIKCPNKEDHLTSVEGNIPVHYYPQLQHQMIVADKKKAYYVSHDGIQNVVVLCDRDDAYCELLLKEEIAFMDKVNSKQPPDFSEQDYHIVNDELMVHWAYQYDFLTKEIVSMEKERLELKKKMTEHCLNPRNLVGPIKICKLSRKGSIDYDSIPELKGVDREAYRKPAVEFWEIRQ